MPSLFKSAASKERAVGTLALPVRAGADSLTLEGVCGRRFIESALGEGADRPCPCVGVDAGPVVPGAVSLTPEGFARPGYPGSPARAASVGTLAGPVRAGADSLTLLAALAVRAGAAMNAPRITAVRTSLLEALLIFMTDSFRVGMLRADNNV